MGTLFTKLNTIAKSKGVLAQSSLAIRNRFLTELSTLVCNYKREISTANQKDILSAKKQGVTEVFLQRLAISSHFDKEISRSLSELITLPDPLGKVLDQRVLANGVRLQKVTTPLGVLLVIYESRPEVTIHAAALSIKSGNCIVLKGGKEASKTNTVLAGFIRKALAKSDLPESAVTVLTAVERSQVRKLLKRNDIFDLVIPRGGYSLVREVERESNIPVLSHSSGGARIYVDKSADFEMAKCIVIDAKTDKPATCNSVDTVLVHKEIAQHFIPKLKQALHDKGVLIYETSQAKWEKEFLDLKVNIGIVENVEDAVIHIQKNGKGHSEGIIAKDKRVIKIFTANIDAAAVFVNCSPRLHDGGVFGMGMETGIATGKLHARGPVGLNELTSFIWIATGKGQTRNKMLT